MFKTTMKVEGMMCGMCEAHVNDAVRREFPKVKKVTSSHGKGETVVISPEELEGMVEKCPVVQECIVKELGKKIGVVVYCEKEHQQTVRDFVTQMNRTVPLYKRIGVVEFSETPLPRNATGKLVRK